MTKYTLFPKFVKILEIVSDWDYGYKRKLVIGRKLHIGKYYVAEHSKTKGINKGDAFIIREIERCIDR